MGKTLYRVRELSDVFVDACLRNEAGELMFLSVFGRDGALQQFLAAFSLPANNGGLDQFHLVECHHDETTGVIEERNAGLVGVQNPDRLTKLTGRLPKDNLFGNLVHTWIYDPVLTKPDRANRQAWIMDSAPFTKTNRPIILERIWDAYKLLSPVPLRDDWKEVVLRATHESCVTLLHQTQNPPIGQICAARIHLPESFGDTISRMVKARIIGLNNEAALYLQTLAA